MMKSKIQFRKLFILSGIFLLLFSCEKPSDLLDPADTGKWIVYKKSAGGLCGNDVRDIITDSRGDIWFACYGNGISRYNGVQWFEYNTSNTPMWNNLVKAIVEDRDGDMWFGTDAGLFILVDETTWYYYLGEETDHINVNTLFMDSYNDIWIGTEGDGFYIYSAGDIYGPIQFSENENLNNINKFRQDAEGYIWMATDVAALRYTGDSWEINPFDLEFPAITTLYPDSKGKLWIAAEGGSSLRYYRNGQFTDVSLLNGQANYFVNGITEDMDGNIWFATYLDGLVRYDGMVMTSFKPYNGFPSEWNSCITTDEDGNIWIGTLTTGAIKYIPPVNYNKY